MVSMECIQSKTRRHVQQAENLDHNKPTIVISEEILNATCLK
jgi:hypothetical protein